MTDRQAATNTGRPRVLVIAEAANPEWVSVPLVGWSQAEALREVADVHVVTQVRNRGAILRAGWREGQDFTAIDSEAISRPLYRLANRLRGGQGKGWTTVTAFSAVAYYHFEHLVWRRFGAAIRGGEYDLVHRLTPLSPTTPSLLATRCRRASVPFVLGPLNGGVPWPGQFDERRREEREWLSYARSAYKLLPGYAATRRDAAAILIASHHTMAQMPRAVHGKCFYLPENGIDPGRFTVHRTRRATRPLRLAFVGRLVPYKGADMLLDAAAPLLRDGRATLAIYGDGPQRGALEAQAQRHGVTEATRFAGWVNHRDVPKLLSEADVMVLASIREFGGGVVLEAMATGVAPLVVDYGGPAELVTDETGFKVPLGDREAIVREMGATLGELASRPELVDEKADAARRRVESLFTWSAKARRIATMYDWLLGRTEARPPQNLIEPAAAVAPASSEHGAPDTVAAAST